MIKAFIQELQINKYKPLKTKKMKHHEHATSILALVEDLKEIKGYKDLLKTELIEIAIKICYLKTLDDIDTRLLDIDNTLTSIDQSISSLG